MAMPYAYPEQETNLWQQTTFQQPRVGLAVVCRCLADGSVECLLQKRGQGSHTPGKWSFPGGRLDQEGDLEPAEDFGAAGTLRELEEECGGGTPPGLPSLIHIMRMYNDPNPDGKQTKQTMYHVYAVDLEKEPDWAQWRPGPMKGHEAEVDTSPTELIINGNAVGCYNGQCWVNLEQLCVQCCQKMQNLEQSPLHPGLIKWVQNHAMNILKYLIARSPKITRAMQKPSSTTTGGSGNMAPRFSRTGSGGRVKRRPPSSSMLAPPLHPGQTILQPILPIPTVVNPLLSSVDLSTVQAASNIQVPIPPSQPGQDVLSTKQPMTPESPIAGTQSMPFSSMAPLTIQTQQQQQIMQDQHQTQKLGSAASDGTPVTSIAMASPRVALQGNTYFSTAQKQPLMSLTPDEHHQALLQLFEQQQQQQQAIAQMMVPRSTSSFRDIPCTYFLSGNCMYGDKCWYSHVVMPTYSVLATQQPLLSPQAGPHTSVASHDVYSFPQQPTIDQSLYYMSSPPQSPVAYFPNSPTWPMGGNRSAFMHYPGRMPGGVAHPNNSRFMLTRYPVNPATIRMPHTFMNVNGPQVVKKADHFLKFALVSEIPINSDASKSPHISHLTTRGDHFYITFDNVLRDYRILLQQLYKSPSGSQTYSLKDSSTLPQVVSCLYCSRDTGQLFIGTENGSIYRWDTKHNDRVDICTNESSATITSLVHFYTSLGSQILVSGNCEGEVTWYIMQPPQKTFTVLLADHRHEPHSVISIQLLGSILLTGAVDGTIHCWNMQSSRPLITTTIRAHSISLSQIHVVNSQHFITVGNNADFPITLSVESPSGSGEQESQSTPAKGTSTMNAVSPNDLATSVIKLALEPSSGDKSNRTNTPVVTLWKFENPPKSVKTFTEFGKIVSSSVLVTKFAGSYLAMSLQSGSIVIYHVPDFTVMPECPANTTNSITSCKLLSLSLARELPSQSPNKEIMLTTIQSDNTVKVYQVI